MFKAFGELAGLRPKRQAAPMMDEPERGLDDDENAQPIGGDPELLPDPQRQPRERRQDEFIDEEGRISGNAKKYQGGRLPQYGFMPNAGLNYSLQDPNSSTGRGWARWGSQRGRPDPKFYSNYLYRPWTDLYYMPKDPFN
jgi:hypothetical protein